MAKKDKSEKYEPKAKEQKEAPKEKKAPVPHKKPAPSPKFDENENFRGIVRIAGKDIKGEVPMIHALARVRGIGHTMAVSASRILKAELSIDPKMKVGELSDEMIDKVDNVLMNLQDYPINKYLLNRRGDYTTGKDRHIIMTDLLFETSQDIERDKKVYSWRGYRHTYGAKVRGQRTRNTGRTGMAVGVLRKTVLAAAAATKATTGGAAAAPTAGAKLPSGAPKPAEKKAAPAAEKK